MKIYFGASISLDRSMLGLYQRIVRELKKSGHKVLSEYVVDPKLKPGVGLTAEKLFARETKTIERADAMVAEVTEPSWGTAFLIEHALDNDKPVLALFYKETDHPLSLMLKGHPELYSEHYDEDNLHAILKKNLEHFKQLEKKKGKLVVIDGADGSGKGTQTKKLLQYLKKQRIKNKYISFPRYYTSFHGKHVGRFLTGEFGGSVDISPYLSSLAFALDRLTAHDELVEWLREGNVVVADRYVSASMAHQGSKMPPSRRKAFIDWLYDMEYKEHKLPREDVVIFLYVPAGTAQKLLQKKGIRRYVKGKDKAEADLKHQRKSIEMYKQLVKKYKHWEMVKCVDKKGELLSIDQVHQKILAVLKKRKII